MKRKRHNPEQIIRKLRTAEQLLTQGQTVADISRAMETSAPTYHRCQQLYGGMKGTEGKCLKELELENTLLKRLLATAELDKAMLESLLENPRATKCKACNPVIPAILLLESQGL